MSIIQPEWVYRIISGLTEYEDAHPNPKYDGGICLMNLLQLAPEDVRRDAALFMAGYEKAARDSGLNAGNLLKPELLADSDPHQRDDGRDVLMQAYERDAAAVEAAGRGKEDE